MKVPVLVVMLFATLIAPSFADAASPTKRAIPAGHAARFDPVARKKLVIAHIKKRLGSYGDSIVTDPRFAIDQTMFARMSNPKAAAPRRRLWRPRSSSRHRTRRASSLSNRRRKSSPS